jgi:hypothetical protein
MAPLPVPPPPPGLVDQDRHRERLAHDQIADDGGGVPKPLARPRR